MPARHASGGVLDKEYTNMVRAGDVVLEMSLLAKFLEGKRLPWTMSIEKQPSLGL